MTRPSIARQVWKWPFATLLALLALQPGTAAAQVGKISETFFDDLEYRHIGPLGNRVSAVAGVAGDINVYYIGAASGGIFKTTDAGATWRPVFDDQPVASIGSLAVAPSDPNVVWAGTGETNIRSNVSLGAGIYRSTDAGESWAFAGLEETGRIGRLAIHPRNSDVVYAAALGHGYGPQTERGLFRTTDGGISWEKVLFIDDDTGVSDLMMDPNNPRRLFASSWQIEIWPWGRQSGGPGGGLHMSSDGGDTWKRLSGEGLPEPPWGKIGLAMTAADSRRVYALIETSSNRDFAAIDSCQGVLWRSDDGGDSWQKVSSDHTLNQRPLYYTRVVAAPDDADEVHFLAVEHRRSIDGGVSTEGLEHGGDYHDLWIDPQMPTRMIVGHDQGISISTTRGASWHRPQLPIAQMYHVHTDDRIPYHVYGNRQDGPSTSGPSRTLDGDDIPVGAWHSVGGCECGFAVPDRGDPEVVWSGCYDGILERYDRRTGHSRNVSVWPEAIESWPASELRYRFQWTFPIAASPHAPGTIYVGSQYVHRTTDDGQSWTILSPDLTTDDKSKQQRSGGLTLDDASPTLAPVIFALAESPIEPGVIWAGTNDGQVQLTRDGGQSWSQVTGNLPELPRWGTVSNIEPSRHAAGTCYLTIDRHQMGDGQPYVYKTSDYGASWRRLSDGIARGPLSYAHCVREDPVRPGLLYLGTENALYVSFDDGEGWHALQSNLPHAPVHWLTVQEHFNDLVVATYGRGFWILDDITPLQQLDAEILEQESALLKPRPTYRFRRQEGPMSQPGDPAAGQNPEPGATLHYHLATAAAVVELKLLDSDGRLVRTLDEPTTKAGLHRLTWDLYYDKTTEVKLRTQPDEHPHETFSEDGWRSLSDGGRFALLAPPGIYTVQLTVDEVTHSEPLEIRKDPGSAGSLADIEAQMRILQDLRGMIDRSARLINEIEWTRKQIDDLEARLTARQASEDTLTPLAALDGKLKDLENEFFDLRLTSAGQDFLRWKRKLYSRLLYLAGWIGQSDFPPTDAQLEVYHLLAARLAEHEATFSKLATEDVAATNAKLATDGMSGLLMDRPAAADQHP